MRGARATRRRWRIAGLVAGLAAAAPALALDGRVVDEQDHPLERVRVCYMAATAETLCANTDDQGRFSLPDTRLQLMRVFLTGYLPQTLPTVPRDTPIRLQRAASIRVQLVDARSGGPIAGAKIWILRPTGKGLGPLPTYDAGVMDFLTLAPGPARVTAEAEGYEAVRGQPVELVAGERAEVLLRLEPRPAGAAAGDPPSSPREPS